MEMRIKVLGELVMMMPLLGQIGRVVLMFEVGMRVVRELDRHGMGRGMRSQVMLVRNHLVEIQEGQDQGEIQQPGTWAILQ